MHPYYKINILIIATFFLSSCKQEKLLLSNSQDEKSKNYLSPPNNVKLSMQDEKTIKIEVNNEEEAPFSAQITRKKSGTQDWIIILDVSESADTLVYFDNYDIELNTTYLYKVRRVKADFRSQTIIDSINFNFLPPILKDIRQITDAKIELIWGIPVQFENDSTIDKILISRDGAGEKTEFVLDGKSTIFIDSTFQSNNIAYSYTLRSKAFSGIISDRSSNHEITLAFSKVNSPRWTPLELEEMQIDINFNQDLFNLVRSISIERSRSILSTNKKIYEDLNPKNLLINMIDNIAGAELEEPIVYKLKWCGEVFCDSLSFTAITLPFLYMKLIPGAEQFILGPEYGNNNSNMQAVVKVDSFYADVYEVRETIYREPGSERKIKEGDLPVSNISWNEAVDFCNEHTDKHFGSQYDAYNNQRKVDLTALGFRLPTEIEWEYMASYGKKVDVKREFPWGDNISGHYANYYDSGDLFEPGRTPVGYYSGLNNTLGDAQSFFGLEDLAGNVMEWCQDWYGDTAYQDHNYSTNASGPISGEARVVRGGGWQSDAIECHNRVRKEFIPTVRHETIGFRTVISAEPFLKMWRNQ